MPTRRDLTHSEVVTSSATQGRRGRNPSSNDVPQGGGTRTSTSPNRTTVISPYMKGYEPKVSGSGKNPKDQVTPGTWTTKNKI